MKTRHNGRAGSVLFALLLAAATVGREAQAAPTVTYVGAEVSTASSGSWGTSGNSGYKKDFRSTDAADNTKAWTLPDHPNAYGADGYIMFGQSDASVTQESSGTTYYGTIYTGTRSGASFNTPAPGIASVTVLGTNNYGTTGEPNIADTWRVDAGNWTSDLDDASLGIGTSVADVNNGTLWYRWYTGSEPVGWSYNNVHDLFRITLDGSAQVRVGIVTDNGDSQRPGAIGLNGVWQPDLIGGQFGEYNRPTWYFFDITDAGAGDTVDIAIKPWPTIYGSKSNIRGLVFDVERLPAGPAGAVIVIR